MSDVLLEEFKSRLEERDDEFDVDIRDEEAVVYEKGENIVSVFVKQQRGSYEVFDVGGEVCKDVDEASQVVIDKFSKQSFY